jgi:hypothetical protein
MLRCRDVIPHGPTQQNDAADQSPWFRAELKFRRFRRQYGIACPTEPWTTTVHHSAKLPLGMFFFILAAFHAAGTAVRTVKTFK